jgi:DNA-nicking Smr family endonuclease
MPLTGVAPLAPKRVGPKPGPVLPDDSALVMQELDDLVSGVSPFDFADTEEFIEASVRGLDRRILRQLRRGEYSVQAHLDLHGMRREEARARVATFVERAHTEGKKCVLIVHGRGLGSKDNIPVLKEKLTAWLTRGAIGKRVLAFTSARPYDGGTGAVYVLLRG